MAEWTTYAPIAIILLSLVIIILILFNQNKLKQHLSCVPILSRYWLFILLWIMFLLLLIIPWCMSNNGLFDSQNFDLINWLFVLVILFTVFWFIFVSTNKKISPTS